MTNEFWLFSYYKQREYVITRPDTPLPWLNYLGNEAYFGIISNTAGGYSFYRDARLRPVPRATVTTTRPATSADATYTCATTPMVTIGRLRGNQLSTTSRIILAVMGWATQQSSQPSLK